MSRQLFVQLKDDSSECVGWLMRDETGKLIQGPAESHIDEVVALAKECEVFAFVPGHDVFLTEAKLPPLSLTRLMKALPYALEDALAEDILQLHFAIGEIVKGNPIPVAVVSKEKMNTWQLRLSPFCQPPYPSLQSICPDVLALPWQPETWTILIDDQAFVRMGQQAGFVVEIENLETMLHLILQQPDVSLPTTIHLIGHIALSPDIVNFFATHHIAFSQQPLQNKLSLMAAAVNPFSGINLLSGPYKMNHRAIRNQILYRTTAVLATAGLLALLLGNVIQYFILEYRKQVLHHEVMANFNRVMPHTMLSINQVKKRMQQELQSLRSNQGDSHFLRMLQGIAPIVASMTDIKLLGMDYSGNQLILDLEANNFATLDKLTQALQAQNYKSDQHDAKKSGDHIQARLFIQETI